MGLCFKKLKSDRGASLLIAMGFFLLCMMVGAVIIVAAATNAGLTKKMREEEQSYLTVSSAAVVLRDEIAAMVYKVAVTTDPGGGVVGSAYTNAVGDLANLINPWAKSVYDTAFNVTDSLDITPSSPGAISDFKTVRADFTMTGSGTEAYDIEVLLYILEGTEKRFQMRLSIVGEYDTSVSLPSGDETNTVTTTTVTWQKGIIEKVEA